MEVTDKNMETIKSEEAGKCIGEVCISLIKGGIEEFDFIAGFNERISNEEKRNELPYHLIKIFTEPRIRDVVYKKILYDGESCLRDHEYTGKDFPTLLGVYILENAERLGIINRKSGKVSLR